MTSRSAILRKHLAGEKIILAPGVYDCITAKLVEQAGFRAIYVSGGGVSKSVIGRPDIGLLTMSEMVDQVRRIALVTSIPIINDADNGYGNVVNVARAVREFEQAGSSGIHIEDQVFPKRCGHFEGKQLISAKEMVGKVKAAINARQDQNFVIIARTDARTVLGFKAAIERGCMYQEAGADAVFIESPMSVEELRKIPALFKVPTMANMVEGGETPLLASHELQEIGYRIVIFPGSVQKCMMKAAVGLLQHLNEHGTTEDIQDTMLKGEERNRIIGLPEALDMIKKYS